MSWDPPSAREWRGYRQLGRLLRHARESQGLTQEALAKRLRRSQEWVSRCEKGLIAVPCHMLQRFVNVTRCEIKIVKDPR